MREGQREQPPQLSNHSTEGREEEGGERGTEGKEGRKVGERRGERVLREVRCIVCTSSKLQPLQHKDYRLKTPFVCSLKLPH